MTAPAATPVPHSRWLVRQNVERLAASYAAAAEAISALHTAASLHRDRSRAIRRLRPPLRQRMAMRQDWPQVIRFPLLLLALAVFLGWVSDRLVAHLAPMPTFMAVLPGVLLAAAAGGSARFTTHSASRHAGADGAGVLASLVPLGAASAGVTTWVSLWLVLTSGTPAWAAVMFAFGLTLATAVALTTWSYPVAAPAGPGRPAAGSTADRDAGPPVPSRPSRRLRAQHRRTRRKLDDHTRQWMTAAHRYAVTIPAASRPAEILGRLLGGDAAPLPLDGLDPFDVMVLSALRNYHPTVLAADLELAWARLLPELSGSAGPD